MSIARARLWRAGSRRGGRPSRPDDPKKIAESAGATVHKLDAMLSDWAEHEFPDMWFALTEEGRAEFGRNLLEAASKPADDRESAVRVVVQAWLDTFRLLSTAPLDDEPFTDEQRHEVEEAEARLGRGEGVRLT